MHRLKKKIFLFGMCKMAEITKETWEENGVEVIVFNGKKWLKYTRNIQKQLGHSALRNITLQYSSEFRKKDKNSKIVAKINFVEEF